MFLVRPDVSYAQAFGRLVADFRAAGEEKTVHKVVAGEADFPRYVASLEAEAAGAPSGAPAARISTFWLLADGEIVGIVRVRHRPARAVAEERGHIGYDVAPVTPAQGVWHGDPAAGPGGGAAAGAGPGAGHLRLVQRGVEGGD